ncbi:lecithin retinol acyltransferase family protein [Sessilibacter corallicola]|uniref:LRAT domain-containing protein n=1 Tax=Sessilibacter corallicola TaxID=2904075 RepID=A0ABQ0ADN9_9GAMM
MNIKLKTGDLLYRSKGFVEHAGVYLGNDKVIHNKPDGNVEITHINQYSKGKTVKVVEVNNCNIEDLKNRLYQLLRSDVRYRLTHQNCEHIANLLVRGRAYSPQIRSAIIGALIAALVASGRSSQYWFFAVVAGGILGCVITNLAREYDYKLDLN